MSCPQCGRRVWFWQRRGEGDFHRWHLGCIAYYRRLVRALGLEADADGRGGRTAATVLDAGEAITIQTPTAGGYEKPKKTR